MAGHWIEWEKGLTGKPEMFRIARQMGVSVLHAAAACMLVWEWAEDNTTDGHVNGMSPEDVSAAAKVDGIAEAMLNVGWLVDLGDAVAFPNWDRHNGAPSKRRALDAMRKRVHRHENKMRTLGGRLSA